MGYKYYKYAWNIEFIIKSIDKRFVPYAVETVIKDSDYDNGFLPNITMQLKIKERDLIYFKKYNNNIVCNIKQIRYSGPDRENFSTRDILSDAVYLPLYDKNSIRNNTGDTKRVTNPHSEDEDVESEYTPSLAQNELQTITFNMFMIEDLKCKKFIHNYIMHESTVSDALSLLVSENPHITGCLIDIPDNTTTYENIIIPPAEIKDAIKCIQMRYGIYSCGIRIFVDNGILYVLKKVSTAHVYKKDEKQLVRINMLESSSNINDNGNVYEDDKQIFYTRKGKINVDDKESILGEIIGDKYVFSNFGSVINSVFSSDGKSMEFVSPINEINRVTNTHIDTGTKVISDYDNLNNVYGLSSHINQQGTGLPISLVLTGICSEHFGPNKNIFVDSNVSENDVLYGGIYSISSLRTVYKSTNAKGNRYETYASCALSLNYKTKM